MKRGEHGACRGQARGVDPWLDDVVLFGQLTPSVLLRLFIDRPSPHGEVATSVTALGMRLWPGSSASPRCRARR